ncbi:MAG: hypothetical protein ACRD35_07850 [Candidatus Acidiferrales bacterium]
MIGKYDLVVAALGVLFSLGTVGVCLWRRMFWRYCFVQLYLLSSALFTVGLYYVYRVEGYESLTYYYFYYTGDSLFNGFGYLLIASFFDRLLRDSAFHRYIRPTLVLFFLGVVAVSARFIWTNVDRLYTRFVFEFQQNMFFVGVLFTFLLWISMNYLRAENRRFVLLVSGLGIYFSSHAANYAMQYLFPSQTHPFLGRILTSVPPLAYSFMVLLWLYTFWKVPEGEAVVEPSRGELREAFVQSQAGRE